MWKPGTTRPSSDINDTTKNDAPSPSKTPSKSASKKKLSGSTMNMRFMLKNRGGGGGGDAESMNVDSKSTSDKPTTTAQHEHQEGFEVATPNEMYSNIFGRRSFGGFNKITEQAWTASRGQKKEKKQSADQEMMDRYKTFVEHGSNGDDQTNEKGNKRSARKRKPSSISNSGERVHLDDE
jgi:hypothetical protein